MLRTCALGLVSLLFSVKAFGAAAPYADWTFDVRRAIEARDLDVLARLAREKPDFARVYFYGQVFDLVTLGVSEEVKSELRPVLDTLAKVLAEGEPPDPEPLLYLDKVDNGGLDEIATAVRALDAELVGKVRSKQEEAAQLAPASQPSFARPVFYGLFYRAEMVLKRLGGRKEHAALLLTARRIAEGYALALGDVGPWRTLASYLGNPNAAPLNGEPVVEGLVGAALNGYLSGDLKVAEERMDEALVAVRGNRGGTLYSTLVLNGTAHAAAWLNDRPKERGVRVQVLNAVRPLERPGLVALLAGQMIRSHLADGTLDEMVQYSTEMRGLGAAVRQEIRHLRVLEEARAALQQLASERLEEGRLSAGARLLSEAEALLELLAEEQVLKVTLPAGEQPEARRLRLKDAAEVRRLFGRVAERQGRYEVARAAYGKVLEAYQGPVGEPEGAGRADTDLARTWLREGRPDQALTHTATARESLGRGSDMVARVENYRVQGWARLRNGEQTKAFANANYALEVLRKVELHDAEKGLRARLHLLAAAALDSAGFAKAARDRLRYALELAPADPEVVRATVLVRTEAGDLDGALEALQGLPESRTGAVWKGCALARAGKHDEALAALAGVPTLTLPHLRPVQLAGRTCAVAALLGKGDVSKAQAALEPARTLALEFRDPALTWRVHALDGAIAAARRDPLGAAGSWRQAADRYVEALAERAARGATLDVRPLAMPATPDFVERLPETLVESARKDRRNAAVHHAAAASYALWARALGASPAGPGRLEQPFRPEADRRVHAAVARTEASRDVVRDESILTAERVEALKALSAAVEAQAAAVKEVATQAPGWGQLLAPVPPDPFALTPPAGRARMVYRIGDKAGHLWVALPGEPVRHYKLGGRAQLEKALKTARAVVGAAPQDWDAPPEDERKRRRWRPKDPNAKHWKALAAPVRAVLPFARDRKLMKQLDGLLWEIHPDGPLVGFPLEALVLSAPPRKEKGAPPTFVGTAHDVVYRLSLVPAGIAKPPAKPLALFGPLAAGECPEGLACGVPEPAPEAAAIASALAGNPAKFTQLPGPAATRPGLSAALAAHANVYSVAPATGGAMLASANPGSAKLEPVAGLELAFVPSAAVGVVLSRVADFERLQAVVGALRFAGTQQVVTLLDPSPDDATVASRIAGELVSGKELAATVSGLRKEAMTSRIDPEKGGRTTYHPYYWARWVRFGE